MLRIGVCMIYFVLYIYQFGFEISYEYISRGLEPTNGEIIPKIKLAK